MASTSFTKVFIYEDLVIKENYNSNVGVKILPTKVGTRADDVTGYVLKAASSDGKVVWAPGTTQTYSLSDLTNTSIPLNVADNSVLTFNAAGSNWIATPKLTKISDLSDVDLTGIVNGDILVYNSGAQEFQATNLHDQTVTGGQEGSIQFRDSSSNLGGSSNMLWNDTNKELTFNTASKILIGGLSIQSSGITGLPAIPTSGTSAVSKTYFDTELANVVSGVFWKEMVEYATTTDHSGSMAALTGAGATLTVDSNNTFSVGERILFKNNGDATNGIYRIATAAHPTYTIARTADLASGSNAKGAVMWVDKGTVNQGYAFICTNVSGSDVVNTSTLTFVEFNASSTDTVDAGQGLVKNINTLNLNFNSSTFNVITDNKLDISATGVTAGTYGSVSAIPSITVNSKGQVSSATSITIPTATTSVTGLLSAADFNDFSGRLSASSLADGKIWIGSSGSGATQRTITGDVTLTSGGVTALKTVAGLPIVAFPNNFTTHIVKVPKITVNTKGIVTNLVDVQLPTASATQFGLLSNTDWTTFNSKLTSSLSSGQMFVGSGGGSAIAKTISGDASIDDNGVVSLKNVVTAGTAGTSLTIPTLTFDNKGRITLATDTAIPTATSLTKGLLSTADYTAFTNKMPNTLATGKLFIGDGSNAATAQTVSGDATMSGTGVLSLATIHSPAPTVDYSSNLKIPRITVNSKGLITSLVGQDIPTASASVKGVLSSTDYTSFTNKLNKADFIGDGKVLIGNGSIVNSLAISGDVTLSNTGRVDIISTIAGNKTLPGDINFTSINGDTSTTHTDTNIKVGGSLGVTGKAYFNGTVSANNVVATNINVGGTVITAGKISNLSDPTNNADAANKQYVDNAMLGIKWITPAALATTQNLPELSGSDPLSNGGKIDNVQLTNGAFILVKNQSTLTQNGVYVINTSGPWARSTDMATTTGQLNKSIFVKSGDVNGASSYTVSNNDNGNIIFTLFSKSASISAGSGLSGISKFNVNTDGITLTIDPTSGSVRMKEIGGVSGSYGSSVNVPTMTTDKYGRILTIANTPIQYASYTNVNTKSPGIISGTDYNTFKNKLDKSLLTTEGRLLIGSVAGHQSVVMSGDATLASTGALTLNNIHTSIPTATNTGITVPEIAIDNKGRVTSLSVSSINYASPTVNGILSSADYNTFSNKLNKSDFIGSGKILVGDGALANSVSVSGDLTLSNSGVASLASTLTGNKTISGNLTVNELVVSQPAGITTTKVDTSSIVLSGALTSTNGSLTVGSTIITNGRIQGLNTPTVGTDAANRDYVDQSATGIKWKPQVATRLDLVATVVSETEPVTLTTGPNSTPVGGYTLSMNDRVLVDSQTIKTRNGIYYVSSVTYNTNQILLTRATDFSSAINVSGFAVYVANGTYAGLSYTVSNSPAVIASNEIIFSTFAGSSSFTAGVGTTKDVNSLNVNYDDVTIGIQTNNLYLKNNSVGTSKLIDASITADKLGTSSVTATKILDGSVSGTKIAANTITNNNISSSAAITPSKLSVSKWFLNASSDIVITGTTEANKVGLGETATITLNGDKVVKTTSNQTISGEKTFSSKALVSESSELIRGSSGALTVNGGVLVKKNLEAVTVYSTNSEISDSLTVSGVNVSNTNNITGVNNISNVNSTTTGTLTVGTTTILDNEMAEVYSISGLITPTEDDHASNKKYVDDSVSQFETRRNSVKCTTSGSLTNPPSGIHDITLTNNVTLVDGDRVLVMNQGNIENGIYVVNTTGLWARSDDYPSNSKADGLTVYDETLKRVMICTNTGATVNNAVLVFEPLVKTGNGLVATGNSISVGLEDSSLAVAGSGKLTVGTVPITKLSENKINTIAGVGINLTNASDTITTQTKLGETLKVAVKLQTNSGLEATSNGLRVLPIANNFLSNPSFNVASDANSKGIVFKINSNVTSAINLGDTVVPEIKLDTNSGLSVSNTGLKLSLVDNTIAGSKLISLAGTKITASTIPNSALVNGNTKIKVNTGSGIEVSNDNGSTYENNGVSTVALGSEVVLKLSNNITKNDVVADVSVPRNFTNTAESGTKTSGAVIIAGGLGVAKDIFSRSINSDTGAIGGMTFAAGKIVGITATQNGTDAASKNYVDGLAFGIRYTDPVRVATTAIIDTATSGSLTIDGISSWTVGDRILVKNQIDTTNGIYEILTESAGNVTLGRTADLPNSTGATGITVYVLEGTLNAGIGFTCTAEAPITFVQFTGGDATDVGDGLLKTGNLISVQASDATILADGTGIKVNSVPIDLLSENKINIIPGSGLTTIFKESDNIATRSDAILGGYTYINLDTNIVKNDVANTFTNTTNSTTTGSGSMILAGGLGVAQQITAATVKGTTITDGTATLTGGSFTGLGTMNVAGNITLSKGTAQTITSAQALSITSSTGNVSINGATFNSSNITFGNATVSGSITLGPVSISSTGLAGAPSISVVNNPTAADNLTRKGYVDDQITAAKASVTTKNAVRYASTGESGLSGTSKTGIDAPNVTDLTAEQRILVKNQTSNTALNGIYIVKAGAWERPNLSALGDTVTVIDGTTNGKKTYICSSVTGGYTFSLLNAPGTGLTTANGVDYDDVTLNLTGNKLQIKAVAPSLITDRSVAYIYGNGITSTGNPLVGATGSFPTLSVDYDNTTITQSGGQLTIGTVPINKLATSTVNLVDTNSVGFVNGSDATINTVKLGETLRVKVKLANSGGLSSSGTGLIVDVPTVRGQLDGIVSSQITSLEGSKLIGTVDSNLLTNKSISINAGSGITVTGTPTLGGTITISANTVDLNAAQTFSNKVTFSQAVESESKLSGALLVSSGGLGVAGKINSGGRIESEVGFKAGSVIVQSGLISGLSNPTESTHAATKSYVDSKVNGSKWTLPVQCATTVAITPGDYNLLTGNGYTYPSTPTIDNVTLVAGNRILLKNQAIEINNGIYTVTSLVPSGPNFVMKIARATDLADGNYAAGVSVFVEGGAINAKAGFVCNNAYATSLVNFDALIWAQVSGSAVYTGLNGISFNGSAISVNAQTSQFEFVGQVLNVKAGGIGSAQIADNNVITSKILNANVTNAKLANSTITFSTAGSGIELSTDNISFSNSITPSLGGTVNLRVNSNVVLKNAASQSLTGTMAFSNTTNSTTTDSGAVTLAGGLGVAQQITATTFKGTTITGTTITDGTATLNGGAFTGLTTMNIAGDITLSKGSAQNITATNNLVINSLGNVQIEGVTMNSGAVSGITTLNVADNITLSKGSAQTITSTNDLTITSTNGKVQVEDVSVAGGVITGITNVSVDNSVILGASAGAKVALGVQTGGGDTTVDFKLPSAQGQNGSVLRNDGTGTMSWVNNNVLYKRTVVSGNTNDYTATINDDYICVTNTPTTPVIIRLPQISLVGNIKYTIIDEGGNAGNNNITIYPYSGDKIIGKSSGVGLVVSGNYNSYVVYNNGATDWFIA